jgi:glucose-1-phosphate thymidylyltransferase
MKCILLAAGYATRLYPLTKDKPKSLLKIGNKTILEYILDKIKLVDEVDEIYLVTNDRFYKIFIDWTAAYNYNKNIKVINDGTTENGNRLGAIGDLQFVVEKMCINEDILVMAGDNLFDFDLRDFTAFYKKTNHDCITTHELNDIEELKTTGVIEMNPDGSVKSFEEKPAKPKTNLAVPPFYIYTRQTVPLIKQYLEEGQNPDAPGNFIPWLVTKKPVYAFKFEGARYDVGTHESYELVNKIFGSRK